MAFVDRVAATYHAQPEWMQTSLRVLAVLVVGGLAISVLKRYARHITARVPGLDRTVEAFVQKLVATGGWILVGVMALSMSGVDVRALLGGLAIGGFILGFALKDTLGNLAAGMMLLFYRPFNIGDTVTVRKMDGEVIDLGVALTTLQAGDGRIITIPNGAVLGGEIINHTRLDRRRADVTVRIDFEDDIDQAVRCIVQAVREDPRVLATPEPTVRIAGLSETGVELQVRPWVKTADYWEAKADMHQTVKRALEGAGCSIPLPQRVIHNRSAA